MAQQFALENLASKINLSEKRARQDYLNKQASEATKLLEKQLDDMQKKAQKDTGFFGKVFGKNAGIAKTLATIALNAIPGVGQVAAFALNAADLAKSQSDMKKNIKQVSQAKGVPARFAGTFLEDYLRGGLMGAQSQLKSGLQGAKQTQLLTGLASLVPGAIGAGKALPQAGQQLGKLSSNLGKAAAGKTSYMNVDPASNKVLNKLFANIERNINAPGFQPAGETIVDQGGLSSIASQAPTKAPSQFLQSLADTAAKGEGLPTGVGNITVGDLLKPVADTGIENPALKALASSALTPANYAPLLQDLYMNYLTKPAGEPVMTRASAPKVY
tara:strand:- start:52 stop:1041 length:990 start_codon:yes stop_codon:yes gene_type:complete